jgi:hypothetical protein
VPDELVRSTTSIVTRPSTLLLNIQTQDRTKAARMNIRIATVRDLLWTLVRRAGT